MNRGQADLSRITKIAKLAIANAEGPLTAGYDADAMADAIMSIALKHQRHDETPEAAFARVTIEDPDAATLFKVRKLASRPFTEAEPAQRNVERAQRQLDAMIARHRLEHGGSCEAAFSAVTVAGEGRQLLRGIRGK